MAGIRERVRAEVTAEIVRLARQQVAEVGAPELSLRAIARDLGMVSSAIYRYFPSRDDLLTQLIIDSYDRLGDAVETAEAACRRGDFRGRWRTIASSIRDWAMDHPSEYALLFGTPVPGYRAPQDTIGPASRYTAVMLQLLAELQASGATPPPAPVSAALRHDFASLREMVPLEIGDAMLLAGMTAWANVMGAISLELFGHLHNVVDTPGALFDGVVELHAERLFGGTGARSRTSKRP